MRKLLLALLCLSVVGIGTFRSGPLESVRKVEALPTASGALSPSPLNNNFTAGPAFVSGPTNYGFENGLTNWTTTGTVSVTSGGYIGNYVNVGNNSDAVSTAFTVSSTGTLWSYWYTSFGTSGIWGRVYVATGPNYNTWTQVDAQLSSVSGWKKVILDFSAYVGQSIKVKYNGRYGTVGFDEGAWRNEAPGWTPDSGDKPYWQSAVSAPSATASAGDYSTTCTGTAAPAFSGPAVRLTGNEGMKSEPFTVPGEGARVSFHVYGTNTSPYIAFHMLLDSEGYATTHTIFAKSFTNGQSIYTTCDISTWAGQKVKIYAVTVSGSWIDVINAGNVISYNASVPDETETEAASFITGAPQQQVTDIEVPGKGIALNFTRTFAPSGVIAQGSLGWGWTHSYNARLTISSDGSATVDYPGGARSFFKNTSGTFTGPAGNYDALVKNGDNTYTLTSPSQIKLNFSSGGKLTSMKDKNQNTTTIAYDGSGYLSTVTDPGGRTLTFTVDGSGRITQIAAPLSRTVGFSYSAGGDLATVTDVKGGTTSYTYDDHRIRTITDQLSHTVLSLTYDTAGRVVEQKDALNNTTCFYFGHGPTYSSAACTGVSPAASAGETVIVDARGNKTTMQYDTSYRLTGVRDALSYDTTFTYEATGSLCSPSNNSNRCSVTDPLGHTTSFTYDARGNMLTRTDANSKTWTYTYNTANQVLTETDPLSRTTTNAYDSNGNLTSVTNALSQVTSATYNSDGTLASVTDPLSHTTTYAYDSYGNVSTKTDALSHAWTYTYDLGGRTLTETDPLSHTTTATYDNMGQPLTVTDPLSNVTTFAYNAKGMRTSVTDAKSKTTSYAFDNADRITTITDPLSQTVTFAYDANGNRTSMTNTRGKTSTYAYDAVNRLTSETDPLSKTTTYAYDGGGRVSSRVDAKSQTTSYGYDDVNRLTSVDYPSGTSDASFTYDHVGNRTGMTDGTGTTTFVLDALYRPTSVTDGASNVIGYAYDAGGRLTTMTYPGGSSAVTYAYDNANRLSSVTDWQSKVTSYTYDNANRLTSSTLGNGLISDRTYDNANRLLSVVNRNGGTTLSSYTYTLDEVGNRTQMVDTSGTSTYTYDGLYRLTGVTYPNSDTQSYTYDAMGNRLTKVHNGSTTTSTYNDGDQMTASGGVSYTYDNNANQTASGSDTFTWDAENRLTATTIGGVSGTYSYTGDGLRSARNIGGSSVSFIWNRVAGLPSVLQDSAGNRYVYGHDLISVEASGGAQTYFLYDGLASTTGLANGSGTVTGTYTYDAFGAVRSQTGTTTEWTYTGEQNDASGLEYLRARYYDKANGRFISRDPLPLLQRYAYANNNPIGNVDPDGLSARSSVRSAGQGVAGYVSSVILASRCWKQNACEQLYEWARDYIARQVQKYGRAARRAVEVAVNGAQAAADYASQVAGNVRRHCLKSDCVSAALAIAGAATVLAGMVSADPALIYVGAFLYAAGVHSSWMNYRESDGSLGDVYITVFLGGAFLFPWLDAFINAGQAINESVCKPYVRPYCLPAFGRGKQ